MIGIANGWAFCRLEEQGDNLIAVVDRDTDWFLPELVLRYIPVPPETAAIVGNDRAYGRLYNWTVLIPSNQSFNEIREAFLTQGPSLQRFAFACLGTVEDRTPVKPPRPAAKYQWRYGKWERK